jgi:hypothetical protein
MSVVTHLLSLENKPPPSKSWLTKWIKTQPLHLITTKPIAHKRLIAQDKKEVESWFKGFRDTLKKHKISRKDVWNFDETGFQIGCPKGQQIYVPLTTREVSYFNTIAYLILIYYSSTQLVLKIDVLLQ